MTSDRTQDTADKMVKKHKSTHGFTLIELLAVMAIITILVGLTLGVSRFARQAAMKANTRAELQHLCDALEEFRLSYGTYPSLLTDDKLVALLKGNAHDDFMDAWGRPFAYKRLNQLSYRIYSQGPKVEIDADDIEAGR